MVGEKPLRRCRIRIVDIANGQADDIGCKPGDAVAQGTIVAQSIHIHDLNLMTVFDRSGDIIESEGIHRIGLCVRIGRNQQYLHRRITSTAVTALPSPRTRIPLPANEPVRPLQMAPGT